MGAHLCRRTRFRHTATDAKIAFEFEANISSWVWQFNTARVACAGCACPAKRQRQSSRGTLATVGILQNRSIRWRLGKGRVRASRECGIGQREERRRAADMVIAGARDAARAGPHFVGWTIRRGRRGKSVGDQPGGGHSMASSIFTQHALQDLRDHDLTMEIRTYPYCIVYKE